MDMKVKLDDGAFVPTRAHETDAGLDLYAMDTSAIMPYNSKTFDTGVHLEIPEGYVGDIKSKSGMMVYNNIITDGTVDCGYTGSIRVKLFNLGSTAYWVERGQKIAQIVIKKIITPDLEIVEELEDTERGTGGFGSTGAF